MSESLTKSDLKEALEIRDNMIASSFKSSITEAVAPLYKSFEEALSEIKILTHEVHKQGENITLLWNNHNEGIKEKESVNISISTIKMELKNVEDDVDGVGKKANNLERELLDVTKRVDKVYTLSYAGWALLVFALAVLEYFKK
jgi:chromosome segregation ATPase